MSNTEEHYLFLINKLLQGNITKVESEELMRLCEGDTERLSFIKYLTSSADTTDLLEAEIVYEKTKPNDLIQEKTIIPAPSKITNSSRLYKIASIAAAIVIVAFASIYYFYSVSESSNDDWQYISTNRGERKFLTLKDGTEVWLNNESELKVLKGYGEEHRRMELKGEGYFSVAKNPKLPLLIHTKDTEVKVIGTVFNLSAYPESGATTTSLIEGKVSLKIEGGNHTKEIIMNPGDQVRISKANIEKNAADLSLKELILKEAVSYTKADVKDDKVSDMLWVDNKLVFNNLTLSEIAVKLGRWYNKEIIIQKDELRDLSFSGTFQEKECTQVLDILKKTNLKINYQMKNDTIYIH